MSGSPGAAVESPTERRQRRRATWPVRSYRLGEEPPEGIQAEGVQGSAWEVMWRLVGARFLVVGAHAMAAHGVPRATGDIDVWVDADPTNAQKVFRALAGFGAPLGSMGVGVADLTATDRFLTNKRSAGRPKDLADVAMLEAEGDPTGDR